MDEESCCMEEYSLSFDSSTLQHELTGLFNFRDSQLSNEYLRFKIASTPYSYVTITTALLSCYLLFYWLMVLMQHAEVFSITLAVLTVCLAIIPLWMIVFIRFQYTSAKQESEQPSDSKGMQALRVLECYAVIGIVATFSLIQIMRYSNGPCTESDFLNIWYCLPFLKCSSIFSETIQFLSIFPLLLLIIMPYVSFVVIVLVFISAMAIIAVSAALASAPKSMIWITCTVIFDSILLYFYQRQQIQLFLFTKRYKQIVEVRERDRNNRATKLAEDTRNMVASISHDLKSVSNVHSLNNS